VEAWVPVPEAEVDPTALERLRALGGTALVGRIIEIYLENAPKRLEILLRGPGGSEWGELERAAHSLKSSSANLGFLVLGELAQEIETMAERRAEAPMAALLKRLEAAYPEVNARLQAERSRLGAPS
jgi:HPt (histidine-containing phosphotransfer) domain-containing protein